MLEFHSNVSSVPDLFCTQTRSLPLAEAALRSVSVEPDAVDVVAPWSESLVHADVANSADTTSANPMTLMTLSFLGLAGISCVFIPMVSPYRDNGFVSHYRYPLIWGV